MNSYERVLMAYTKQKSDHVPIYCGSVSSGFASKILGREAYVGGGIQRYRETLALYNGEDAHKEFLERSRRDAYEWAEKLDVDFVRTSYWRYPVKPDEKIDDHTFKYINKDGSYKIMKFFPDAELFECMEDTSKGPEEPDDLESVVEAMEESTEKYTPSPDAYNDYLDAMKYFKYQKASYAGGLSVAVPNTSALWYEACALRPDLVDRYLECHLKRALKNIPMLSAAGVKFVFGGGDCAGNHGLMYSAKMFREMVVPRFRKISDKCHKYGLYHTFGSDGNFWAVSDSLYIDSGIDGHYEADCTCGMDIRSVRSKYPNITVIGGIGAATLSSGTQAMVKEQVSEAINAAKEYGGAVVGCSNLLSQDTPMENFTLMMDILHREK